MSSSPFYLYRNDRKISNLINAIRNQFGRMIIIEATARNENQTLLEFELDYQFRNETRTIEKLATDIKNKTDTLQQSYEQLFVEQRNTDRICAELFSP